MSNIRNFSDALSDALLACIKSMPILDTDPLYATLVHALSETMKPLEKVFASIDGTVQVRPTAFNFNANKVELNLAYETNLTLKQLAEAVPSLDKLQGLCLKAFKNGVKLSPADRKVKATFRVEATPQKGSGVAGLDAIGCISWAADAGYPSGTYGQIELVQNARGTNKAKILFVFDLTAMRR